MHPVMEAPDYVASYVCMHACIHNYIMMTDPVTESMHSLANWLI